jgi:hypothetical protein
MVSLIGFAVDDAVRYGRGHRPKRRKFRRLRFSVRITSLRELSGPPLRVHGVLAPNVKLRALVVVVLSVPVSALSGVDDNGDGVVVLPIT